MYIRFKTSFSWEPKQVRQGRIKKSDVLETTMEFTFTSTNNNIVLCFVVLTICIESTLQQSNCYTPQQSSGNCIDVKDCEFIVELLQKKPLTDVVRREITRYQCDTNGDDSPKVCCPEKIVTNGNCKTPDGQNGRCISIHDCQFIKAQFETRPISGDTLKRLKKYQCGFDDTTPNVCCPEMATDNLPFAQDVSKHRNVHLLNANDCGRIRNADQRIHSHATNLGEFPWMALVKDPTQNLNGFVCGGTLINTWYVLTAANCLSKINNTQLATVRFGEYDLKRDIDCQEGTYGSSQLCAPFVQDIGILKIIIHPFYQRTDKILNDIGLIRLAWPVQVTDFVAPICLPLTDEHIKKDFDKYSTSSLKVSGWGIAGTKSKSSVLMKATVPYVPNEKCQEFYEGRTVITNKQMCSGGNESCSDCCPGDSGAPLQSINIYKNEEVRYTQYGIVSFGPTICGVGGHPEVYTRIVYFLDWILDTIHK